MFSELSIVGVVCIFSAAYLGVLGDNKMGLIGAIKQYRLGGVGGDFGSRLSA